MSQVSHPLPMAGDYLVVTFADMMHSNRFRRHVWDRMNLGERRRLESLRLQALYGNAPDYSSNNAAVTKQSEEIQTAASVQEGGAAQEPSQAATTATPSSSSSPSNFSAASASSSSAPAGGPGKAPLSPPRWFDIAGRARYNAWVALRGRMSPDVAAECFCAEFLGVIKKYPHPALLTPVEAALSTAHGLAQRVRTSDASPNARQRQPFKPTRLLATSAAAAADANAPSAKPGPLLQVRALQGDPAALALLWICRAYRISCEFVVEPLSKALGSRRRAPSRSTASTPPPSHKSTDPYLPYTMADACYPFSASLIYPSAAATSHALAVEGAAPITVTTPEAAFVLLADTFLAAYPHWMGVPADVPSTAVNPSALVPPTAQAAAHRCGWIDELQHITRHVRTPILALLVHHATQGSASATSTAETTAATAAAASGHASSPAVDDTFSRAALRRAVAAHLHRYESWTMDRVLQRRVGQAQSVLSPLLAATAVVDALRHAYAPDAKAVTAADVFIASCGYVLCTHPFCADVFPLLRVPATHVGAGVDEAAAGVRSRWSCNDTAQMNATAAAAAATAASVTAANTSTRNDNSDKKKSSGTSGRTTYAPWALPLYLSGLPGEYNEKINRLLRRETKGATQHERQQQPVRLLLNDNDPAPSSAVPQHGTGQHYEVSAASATKEAAEAVGQLIFHRLAALVNDDLQYGDDAAQRSHSSLSGAPFLVLRNVFALTWALTQEQVPAFPYFMLDGNPDHFGGFSFLTEEQPSVADQSSVRSRDAREATAAALLRSRPRFQVALAPATVPVSSGVSMHTDVPPVTLPALVPGSAPTPSASSQDGGASIESQLRSGLHAAGATFMKGLRRLSGASKEERESQQGHGSGVHATHVLRSAGESSVGATSEAVGSGGGAGTATAPAHL